MKGSAWCSEPRKVTRTFALLREGWRGTGIGFQPIGPARRALASGGDICSAVLRLDLIMGRDDPGRALVPLLLVPTIYPEDRSACRCRSIFRSISSLQLAMACRRVPVTSRLTWPRRDDFFA